MICVCASRVRDWIRCGRSTGLRSEGKRRMSTIRILAPFDGWCDALDAVPDPVFAGRMLGDGLAIDPTGAVVLAPCAGEIITLPASAHAVSIRAADGVDVLVHVGIDTVTLNGRGFEARVRPGARVHAGDELIRFDLDVVARGAKSLMTPVLVTPMDGLHLLRRHTVGPVAAGDLLFEIEGIPEIAAARSSGAAAAPSGAPVVQTLIVMLRQGLHARPAAILAQRAKAFGAASTLRAHGRSANARSVVAIMALGDKGGNAAGRRDVATPREPAATQSPAPLEGVLLGVAAVAGFAVGRATR